MLDRSLENFDWRTIGDERRARRSIQSFGKLVAIESGEIGVKLKFVRIPNFPAWMFDSVFATASANAGIAPMMFRNEFGV